MENNKHTEKKRKIKKNKNEGMCEFRKQHLQAKRLIESEGERKSGYRSGDRVGREVEMERETNEILDRFCEISMLFWETKKVEI